MNIKQQPVTIQVVNLQDALMLVPEFNGRNIYLAQFIEGCNEAKCMIEPESEIKGVFRFVGRFSSVYLEISCEQTIDAFLIGFGFFY